MKTRNFFLKYLTNILLIIYLILMFIFNSFISFNSSDALLFILFFGSYFLIRKIITNIILLPITKNIQNFQNTCDIDTYIKNLTQLYNDYTDSAIKEILKFSLITADTFKNDITEATLHKLEAINVDLLNNANKLAYKETLGKVYIKLEKYTEVKNLIKELDKEKEKKTIQELEYTLNLNQNNLEGIEEYLKEKLKNNQLLTKVVVNYSLGIYYQKSHNNKKAIECYNYVINNGNNLIYVKQAKEKLLDLNK